MESKEFDKKFKPAVMEDFAFGKSYYTRVASADGSVSALEVKSTGHLAKDASIFSDNVLRGQAYLQSKTTKKPAKKTAAKKSSSKK
jgi:hypothetical protein